MMRRAAVFASLVCAALLAVPLRVAAADLMVYCAASLTDVMPRLAADFEAASGTQVALSFGASSTLARQIEAGAQADVFVSADEAWMDYLADRRLIDAATRVPVAANSLVLVAPADSALKELRLEPGLDLAALLGERKLALGDPAHVPAGRYAQAALEHLGAWAGVRTRIAPAESVRVALVYVERKEAPLGIVYATDVRGVPGVKVLAQFPATAHPPIRYPAAVLAGARTPQATAFVRFLHDDAGARWRAFGFAPLGAD